MFTIKCSDGVHGKSFKEGDKVYIAPEKLLPMARFLPYVLRSHGTLLVHSLTCCSHLQSGKGREEEGSRWPRRPRW